MICDTLANLAFYKGIHPNLDTAIEYLLSHDLSTLENGRNAVDGDEVFINVMDAAYHAAGTGTFEAHRTYADIQISLTGDESIGWLPLDVFPDWDANEESGLFADFPKDHVILPMKKDHFVIMFPQDAHAPGIGEGKGRKAVVKVKVK